MGKFYKVNVYERPKNMPISIESVKKVGTIIVEKKVCYAREIMTEFPLEIHNYQKEGTVWPAKKSMLKRYGRELYIDKSDFDKDNLVNIKDVEKYLDSFNIKKNCLRNEIEEDKRRKQDKKKIKQKIRKYRGEYE